MYTSSIGLRFSGRCKNRRFKNTAILMLTLVCATSFCKAEGIISPLWPDRGMLLRDQLWSFSFVNPVNESYMAYVELTINDPVQGGILYSGVSSQFQINPGANMITRQKVEPVVYNNLSQTYRLNILNNFLLPPGIFNICYRLVGQGGEADFLLGEGCFVFESDPLTPPQLVLPVDRDSISSTTPFFNWLPPTPAESLIYLNYTIRVVEKDSLQSPQEAIERNAPVFVQNQISQNYCNYSNSATKLDSNKIYAWQVIAYNDNSYVGASECWQFSLSKNANSDQPELERPYVPMVREGAVNIVNISNILNLKYVNESGDSTLEFHIKEQGKRPTRQGEEDVIYRTHASGGDNYISIDFRSLQGIGVNKIYEVSLSNSRGEHWQISFKRSK